ncbi:PP2C-like domain-containing protein, partial [Homarus americanus]
MVLQFMEMRGVQPAIVYGRTCEELPSRALRSPRSHVLAAFTGPGGGLTSVNRGGHPPLQRDEADLDYIDADDATSDAQPNAYVTSQKPPPRKTPYADIAAYFRKRDPKSPVHKKSCGGVSEGRSMDSLDCEAPSWRGEAPSPLSPNPDNQTYESDTQSTPTQTDNADRACENGNNNPNVNPPDDSIPLEVNEGGLANQRAKFLTLDLVEAGAMAVPDPDLKRSEKEEIAGLLNWNRPHKRAYGLSTTLYERHPVTSERAGNPIADAFGVVAREDSAILALADGVNWGEKATGHLRGSLTIISRSTQPHPPRRWHADHLNCRCSGSSVEQGTVCGSHDIYSMRDMRDALGALGPVDGQNPELNNLTCSLTYCDPGDIVFLTSDGISDNFDPVVGKFAIPRKEKETKSSSRESQSTERPNSGKGPREQQNGGQEPHGEGHKSEGNKTQNSAREPRGSGQGRRNGERQQPTRQHSQQQQRGRARRPQQGAKEQPAGPGRGVKQPVSNVKSVGAGLPEDEDVSTDPFLPLVEAHQRHELTLLRMEDLLRCGLTSMGPVTTAQGLCLEMVHFATKLTVAKRRILEDPDLYPSASKELSRSDQRNRRRKVCEKLALVPGKLDHATVVAYTVGAYREDDSVEPEEPIRKPIFRAAPLASPDSTRSLISQLDEVRPPDLPAASTSTAMVHSHNNDSDPLKKTNQGSTEGKWGEKGAQTPRNSQNTYSQNKENLSPNTDIEGVTKVVLQLSGGIMVTYGDWGQDEQLSNVKVINDGPIK